MDLAQLIVGAAAQQLREDSMAEACTLSVVVKYPHPESDPIEELEEHFWCICDEHFITATPMCQHVLLQYNGMSLKLPRPDSGAWEDIVSSLYTAIKDNAYSTFERERVNDPTSSWSINPYDPPKPSNIVLKVTAKSGEVISASVGRWEALETKLRTSFVFLRHSVAVQ
jgi:hypothetical protein